MVDNIVTAVIIIVFVNIPLGVIGFIAKRYLKLRAEYFKDKLDFIITSGKKLIDTVEDHEERLKRLEMIRRIAPTSVEFSDKRALILDDNPIVAEFFSTYLKSELKMNVITAHTYNEAVETINAVEFDVGIFDVHINGKTGIDFARYCKEKGKLFRDGKARIILYSANSVENMDTIYGVQTISKLSFGDMSPIADSLKNIL